MSTQNQHVDDIKGNIRQDGQTYPRSIGYGQQKANQTVNTNHNEANEERKIEDGVPIKVAFASNDNQQQQQSSNVSPIKRNVQGQKYAGQASGAYGPQLQGGRQTGQAVPDDETLDLQFDATDQISFQYQHNVGPVVRNFNNGGFDDIGFQKSQNATHDNNLTTIPSGFNNDVFKDESKFMDQSAVNDFFKLDSNRQRQESLSEKFSLKMIQKNSETQASSQQQQSQAPIQPKQRQQINHPNHQQIQQQNLEVAQSQNQHQQPDGAHQNQLQGSQNQQHGLNDINNHTQNRQMPQIQANGEAGQNPPLIAKGPSSPDENDQLQFGNQARNTGKLIDDGHIQGYRSQLSINKPFATNEFAQRFCVCNPRKATSGDHIVYTVYGEDSIGRFEIQRRYSEFHLLRQVLYQRYPGLYVPPVPKKRKMGNNNQAFIEERCFYLNMFFKQLVRCPYLYESDELKLFIRPHIDVSRALTFLPKLNNLKLLEKLTPFYSVLGDLDPGLLVPINQGINEFCVQCRRNIQFMEKFRDHVLKMEASFDSRWGSNAKLNNFFFQYEKEVLSDHLLSLSYQNKGIVQTASQSSIHSQSSEIPSFSNSQFILFENENKKHLKAELQNLPNMMENPYQILRRFIKWELMDLEAMIETIESKNEMEKRKNHVTIRKAQNYKELNKLQRGNSFFGNFQSKNGKINRITDLTDLVEQQEKEIDCAQVLTKIVYMYLQDVAIPFFRQDKLGVYNGAINLYASKQINNCNKIAQFYEKVIGLNQIEASSNQVGNCTVLDEKSLAKHQFMGKFKNDFEKSDMLDDESASDLLRSPMQSDFRNKSPLRRPQSSIPGTENQSSVSYQMHTNSSQPQLQQNLQPCNDTTGEFIVPSKPNTYFDGEAQFDSQRRQHQSHQ